MAIKVDYWAAGNTNLTLHDLEGIGEFREALAEEYTSIVRGRPGALGGLYNLSVEIVSTLALSHVVRLLLDGVAFDLIKEGTKTFVLRPFLTACRKLRERNGNKPRRGEIEELRLIFQDSVVIIDYLGDDSIASSLDKILQTLAKNYQHLALKTGERPFEIYIPIFEDPAVDRPSRFRVLVHYDETIPKVSASDYFVYWGLWFDFSGKRRVYDVPRQLLIDEEFLTKRQYWDILSERWKEAARVAKKKE
ncbi:MAG: hypothetical protein WB249_06970 [Candidatus Sulfotelmatobacter sp.]